MKGLLVLGFATLLSSLTTLMPSAASARACPMGCGRQARACVQTARVNLLTCLAGCRATTPAAGGCADACTTTFRAAKSACRADRVTCREMCPPPPPPSSCAGAFLDTCGAELAACARGVVVQAKACVQACKGVADQVGCLGGGGGSRRVRRQLRRVRRSLPTHDDDHDDPSWAAVHERHAVRRWRPVYRGSL